MSVAARVSAARELGDQRGNVPAHLARAYIHYKRYFRFRWWQQHRFLHAPIRGILSSKNLRLFEFFCFVRDRAHSRPLPADGSRRLGVLGQAANAPARRLMGGVTAQ